MGDVVALLGSGKEYGCELTYRVQDEAGGIAQALGLAQRFGRGGRLAVILGDNIFEGPMGRSRRRFATGVRRQDPGQGGRRPAAATASRRSRATESSASSRSRNSRRAAWPSPASTSTTRACTTSSRAHARRPRRAGDHRRQQRLHRARRSDFDVLPGWWTDAGTFESFARANELLRGRHGGQDDG